MVRFADDLKSAFILSGGFAIAAATAVPLLLPALPEEARSLPIPLPVFCVLLAIQMTILYGLISLAGLRLARRRGLEPAPGLTSLWQVPDTTTPKFGIPALLGLGCGVLLVIAVAGIQHFIPGTLPRTLHPVGIPAALTASIAGSIGEEILFRLFVLSLLSWILPSGRVGTAVAIGASALAFGAAHAPGFIFLFGGWREVPPVSWVWLIALNGICGVTYSIIFLRYGILSAIAAHLATDVVWHAASQLIPS